MPEMAIVGHKKAQLSTIVTLFPKPGCSSAFRSDLLCLQKLHSCSLIGLFVFGSYVIRLHSQEITVGRLLLAVFTRALSKMNVRPTCGDLEVIMKGNQNISRESQRSLLIPF